MNNETLFSGIEHSEQYLERLQSKLGFQYERETGSRLPELSLTSSGQISREAKLIERELKGGPSALRFALSVAAAGLLARIVQVCADEFKRRGAEMRQSTVFRFMRLASEIESLQSLVVDVCRDVEAGSAELPARVDALYIVAQEGYSALSAFLVQSVGREGGEIVGLSGLLGVIEMALLIQNQVLGEEAPANTETISNLLGIH